MTDIPEKRSFSGKLPQEFVDRFYKDTEKFRERLEAAAEFDIQKPYLLTFTFEEPFFASLSARIRKVRTLDVPTAAVGIRSDVMHMFWNQVFFNELVEKHVYGVIKHELFHVALEHIVTRIQKPHCLWNAATDCAINCLIPIDELPEFVLQPGQLYTPDNVPPGWTPGPLAELISKLPRGESAEWYMNKFLQDPAIKAAMARAKMKCKGSGSKPCDGEGQSNGKSQGDGGNGKNEGETGGNFEKELEKELYGDDDSQQFDGHDVWGEMSDDEREIMRDIIRDAICDCVHEAESRGWGSIPASMQGKLKELISNEIDWRDLINMFVGKSRSTKTTSSIKRINRRYPWVHPGRKRAYSAKPGLAVDQSGSMRDWWVELIFAEMSNLGNIAEYDIIPFDHSVDEENIQNIRRGQRPDLVRVKHGGTNFSAPVKYVNDRPGKYDALFILTDGECCSPIECKVPMAYILAPGCQLGFKTDKLVIKMRDTRKR